MNLTDLRATLEAIAAGKQPAQAAPDVVDPNLVKGHQSAFRAWERLASATRRRGGEALAAPSELLTPLP